MPLIQGLHQLGETAFQKAGFHLPGMVSLERDFVFSSIILAALVASLIDRKVLRAAGWAAVAALLSWFGVIHAWKITPERGHQHLWLGGGAHGRVSCDGCVVRHIWI